MLEQPRLPLQGEAESLLGSNGKQRKRTLHLSLGVDNDSRIVLKIYEDPVLPPPGFPLAHHHCWQHCKHRQTVRTSASHRPCVCLPGHLSDKSVRPL